MVDAITRSQQDTCRKYGVPHHPAPGNLKMGIALNIREGILPINGLRHPPDGDTTGWYVWAGQDLLADPDFFKPLHVSHLSDLCPVVQKFLGLPPGWRFIIAGEYEDVWYDEALLDVAAPEG